MRAALLALLASAIAGAAEPVEVANPGLRELSGLAVSRADPAVLWGHNDTGGGNVLFRFGADGADFGSVHVNGARSTDWEDIAAFEQHGTPALLIADTGDNLRARSQLVLYAVRDPGREGPAELLWRLPFSFPDGARDCEAVAVDEAGREILLVSKRDVPPRLYRLPLPERTPAAPLVAEFLTELAGLPAPDWRERIHSSWATSPTALDISRDGALAALVTTRQAYLYRRSAGTRWAQAFREPAAVVDLPPLPQIEAAALSPDGRELIVGTEGRPARLARIALPQ